MINVLPFICNECDALQLWKYIQLDSKYIMFENIDVHITLTLCYKLYFGSVLIIEIV